MPQHIFGENVEISDSAIIGKAYRPLLDGRREPRSPVDVGNGVYIGDFVVVGSGVIVGDGTIVDDYCKIEPDVRIGRRNLLIYSALVCCDVVIGDDNVIGGFIGERTSIGNNNRLFGKVVHRQDDPSRPWDTAESAEGAPSIGNNCFIGFGAVVIGHVVLSDQSYVAAGAIVTKDVPSRHVVIGCNKKIPIDKWKGALSLSPIFRENPQITPSPRDGI
jgi:acetyltransferase-like isoleucine patch superfamily enzyme